jgi:hypothetical protein
MHDNRQLLKIDNIDTLEYSDIKKDCSAVHLFCNIQIHRKVEMFSYWTVNFFS